MTQPGDRVVLIRMGDDPYPIQPGSTGTVAFVDGLGTVHVRWDDGRTLGLTEDDEYRLLPAPAQLPYLTDEELAALRAQTVRRAVTWTHHGQRHTVTLTFRMASAAYIDVLYNDRPIGVMGAWDYTASSPGVRTPDDFHRAVDAYWADTQTIRDTIRGGLGLPIGDSPVRPNPFDNRPPQDDEAVMAQLDALFKEDNT